MQVYIHVYIYYLFNIKKIDISYLTKTLISNPAPASERCRTENKYSALLSTKAKMNKLKNC